MTDLVQGAEIFLALLLAALLPALVWLNYIRRTERYEREQWGTLLGGFFWGALVATFVALVAELILIDAGTALSNAIPAPEFTFLSPSSPWNQFFLVLVIAPFVEEGLKAAGTIRSLGPIRTLADGPVVGASVGLGFGFFETFLYGAGEFLVAGLLSGLLLILIRSLSSVLLHGSSTAMFGYGYAKGQLQRSGAASGSYYLLAVGMHASFNLLASLAVLLPLIGITGVDPTTASLIGLLAAMAFAIAALQHVRAIIDESDYPGASGVHPRYRSPPARIQQGR